MPDVNIFFPNLSSYFPYLPTNPPARTLFTFLQLLSSSSSLPSNPYPPQQSRSSLQLPSWQLHLFKLKCIYG